MGRTQADLSARIRNCGQNKPHPHLFGKWIDNSSMADRDPTLTVDKNEALRVRRSEGIQDCGFSRFEI
jgi:hypothetical protein